MKITLSACPQCLDAITSDIRPDEPGGLCWVGHRLYTATVHDAGIGIATGNWTQYDAAHAAYNAHAYGAADG